MKKTSTPATETVSKARVLSGIVVSDKMKDTVVIKVERFVQLPKYKKYVTRTKKYKAHDVGNTKKIGEKIEIVECRPISKDKRFIVKA